MKAPHKVHGFGFVSAAETLPVQNAHDPMIKAYFDLSSRSGNLEDQVRKLPDLRDRIARVETLVRKAKPSKSLLQMEEQDQNKGFAYLEDQPTSRLTLVLDLQK